MYNFYANDCTKIAHFLAKCGQNCTKSDKIQGGRILKMDIKKERIANLIT